MKFYRITIYLVSILSMLILRFKSPELTETQLFLRYWWVYAILVAQVLLAEYLTIKLKQLK
jgi:uncharacterized membrane protein